MNSHRAAGPAITPGRIITDPEVRRYLYGIATAAVPLLVGLGLFTAEHGGMWLAVVGSILAPAGLGLAAVNTPGRDLEDEDPLEHE